MVSSPTAHRGNLAASGATETGRQRSILAKLIASVAPSNCEDLARALLDEFQSIGRIWNESPEALVRILGPESPVVPLIVNARTAALETMAADLRGIAIDPLSPALVSYLISSMGSLPAEALRILFLDGSRRLIADEQLQHGTLNQLAVYPRTIFRRALEHNAAGLILVHNHPSGEVLPSAEDIEVTRRLDQIGRSLDIEIIDHIVVTAAFAHHIINPGMPGKTSPRPSANMLKSPGGPRPADQFDLALANAKATMRRRLLRQQLLGAPDLFGDPAWEMLVDLFIHDCEGKPLSVTAFCVNPSIPMSSALRLSQKLCEAGLISRLPDPLDGRRSFVSLEPATAHRLRAYFEEGPD